MLWKCCRGCHLAETFVSARRKNTSQMHEVSKNTVSSAFEINVLF